MGVNTTNLPTVTLSDEVIVNREGSTARQAVVALAQQMVGAGPVAAALSEKIGPAALVPLQNDLSALADSQTFNQIVAATWAELLLIDGTLDAQGAEVLETDVGTHSQATGTGYNGGTVNNAGRYTWSEGWSRWVRIGETGLAGVRHQIDYNRRRMFAELWRQKDMFQAHRREERGFVLRSIARARLWKGGIVRYCDPNASGTGDGLSWANAFTTFNAAMNAMSNGDVLYTNAPRANPFPKQRVELAAVLRGIEVVTDAGPDRETWIDGRLYGSWTETAGIWALAGVTEQPEFLAYDLKADDVDGTVTGVRVSPPTAMEEGTLVGYRQAQITVGLQERGLTPEDAVAYYGFCEKEAVATTTPDEGKWSWVADTIYFNPPGSPDKATVDALTCYSDKADGLTIAHVPGGPGFLHDSFIHGKLRIFFSPARGGPNGYSFSGARCRGVTVADMWAWMAGYHCGGFASNAQDGNQFIDCGCFGHTATNSGTGLASAFVFYLNNRTYWDANQNGHNLFFMAWPLLRMNGAPLNNTFTPQIAYCHTDGVVSMGGVRWTFPLQIDFVGQLEEKHSINIPGAFDFIYARNVGDNAWTPFSARPYAIQITDGFGLGKRSMPQRQMDHTNCRFDCLGYGSTADNYNIMDFGTPAADNKLRMTGGYIFLADFDRFINNASSGDSAFFDGVHFDVQKTTDRPTTIFAMGSARPDIRMRGCAFTANANAVGKLSILRVPANQWKGGIVAIKSLGGNIYDANITAPFMHSNSAVTPETMAYWLANTDTADKDTAGVVGLF